MVDRSHFVNMSDSASFTRETVNDPEDLAGEIRPADKYGQLQVIGTDLCAQDGEPVQLTGISSHALHWFGWGDTLTQESLDVVFDDWEADIFRIAMHVALDGAYEDNPEEQAAQVDRVLEELERRGMYAIVDFHNVSYGDPQASTESAKTFFENFAEKHKDKDNIIYEIVNEPHGVEWATIKDYAEEVIPVIRKYDDSPVVVGTREYCQLGLPVEGADAGPQEIIDNPVDAENILYSFHFYAEGHGRGILDMVDDHADQLPLICTEWGSMNFTGDGESDFELSQEYIDMMERHNISWCWWNYSDDYRTSGVWVEDSLQDGEWSPDDRTDVGDWIRNRIKESGVPQT